MMPLTWFLMGMAMSALVMFGVLVIYEALGRRP
jgi:hypothetical protein